MKAVVTEIQVGGGRIVPSLYEACKEYMNMIAISGEEGFPSSNKIHFDIKLPNGETKYITIRDEDGGTIAYGNFEGLPSMLDYAQEVIE